MKRREIVAVALEANPTSNQLYEILLDEQVCKILSQERTPISCDNLISKLLEQNIHVNVEQIKGVVNRLKNRQYIPQNCKGNAIYLSEGAKQNIEKKAQEYEDALWRIIHTYFTDGIDTEETIIKKWMQELLSSIFTKYYVNVLSHVTNASSHEIEHLEIDKLHKDLVEQYQIDGDNSIILLSQFKKMLSTYKCADVSHICNYFLNSCYASQVLTGKTFTSPSVADIFRDKTIILDTNILIALQLEKQTHAHVDMAVVEDLCQKLNIKLKCLQQTIDEYHRVISYKREQYNTIISSYSSKVLEQTKYDNILHALRLKGCYQSDAVVRFFDDYLMTPPTSLGENLTSIDRVNKEDSYSIFEFYKQNEQDKKKLRNIFAPIEVDCFDDETCLENEKKVIKKKDGVVEHDLGLIGYVRTLRGYGEKALKQNISPNDNTIILTMDSSLVSFTKSQYANECFVYNIRDVITLLALDRGGLLGNFSDFTPMLSKFVSNNFLIWEDTFDTKDLTLVMNLERQVASLDDVKVMQISRELHKMRCKNTPQNDINRFLQKELNFEYNKINQEKIALIDEKNEQAAQIRQQNQEIERLKTENKKIRLREFNDLLGKEQKKRRRKKCCFIIGVVLGLILLLFFILFLVLNICNTMEWVIKLSEKCVFFNRVVNIMKPYIDIICTVVIFVLEFVGFSRYRNLKDEGYFEKSIIKKYVLENMKVEKEIEDYILNGKI